ncbi:hypothetical protein SpCBS45565_g06636 [Spizellomyces sp. 'palustris']|nr:hypothetical protein SpCBS45565_g06636 [Spizellomyces sp. 'palustris']
MWQPPPYDEELFGSDVDAEGSEDGEYEVEDDDQVDAQEAPLSAGVEEPMEVEEEVNREYDSGEITVQEHVGDCAGYEIDPFASLVHPTNVNCMAATRNMRWLFTGGDDGFIRKFDFAATIRGEQLLTQTQRHGLVDSIEKAGVLVSAWENEEFPSTYTADGLPALDPDNPPPLAADWSPVYSIDVHSEAHWCLTGCKSGNINLWSIRHDEGHCQHILHGHNNAVSVLRITPGERGVISGSWDRTLLRWDLNTGEIIRSFQGVTSQVTSVSFSPSPASCYPDLINTEVVNGMDALAPSAAEDSLLMATSYDGAVLLFDQRHPSGIGRKLVASMSGAPPWTVSASWSADGRRIYCGRRNATVDEFDVAEGRLIRTIRLPRDSGPVSYVTALPNNRHLLCASQDIIRLWDLDLTTDSSQTQRDVPAPAQSVTDGRETGQSSTSSSPPASAISTPKLPTAGLTLFLDEAMGTDSVLGASLSGGMDSDTALVPATGGMLGMSEEPEKAEVNGKGGFQEEDFDTAPVVPFTIVPGHNSGVVSSILIDPSKRYLISASGTRGWDGVASNLCLVYYVNPTLRAEE